jgi:hypothetical protein
MRRQKKAAEKYTIPSRCCPHRHSRRVVIGGHLVRYLCTCGQTWKAGDPPTSR